MDIQSHQCYLYQGMNTLYVPLPMLNLLAILMAHIENTAMFTFLYNRRDRFSYYNSVIVEFIIYNIDYYIGIKILYAYYNRYYIRY